MSKRIVIFGWADRVHVQRWARGLADRGFQIKVISHGGEPLPDIDTTIFPRRNRWGYVQYAGKAAAVARKFQPDLVHVHYAAGFGIWGLKTQFSPTVVSVWGSDVVEFPSGPLSRGLIRKVLTRADHVTATSRELKRVAAALCPTAEVKTTVIPFGVSLPPEPAVPQPELPLRLIFAKHHHPRYAPEVLIKAMVEVVKVIPDVKLTLAGAGPTSEELHKLADDLNLSDVISFPGFIPPAEMYRQIQEHHIMLMPSRYEAFGVAAAEAGACSRPIIATDVGGVSEVVADGVTGVLVPPDDSDALAAAIIKLGRDKQARVDMGCSAYERVRKHFRWDKSLDMMTELYERLIHASK
jgi:glycosyltransferase involved in cell wall biosynthesis